mmetsp:Transcript_7142/g.22863  ORF Transcript_7142/g.22863 Transcript_7142/m.22863 type:complete len:240 (-) Transcript_7142:978-1697(-)
MQQRVEAEQDEVAPELEQLERPDQLGDHARQQRRHGRRLAHQHREQGAERGHVAEEDERLLARQPLHHREIAGEQLVDQRVRLVGLGWRAADHAGVGGRHVGGGGVSSGRRGRGVCARRHRRRRHPCRAQVGEVGREPGELGAGEAVLPQCRVDAARVAGQVAQHRAEAAKGDWALHGGRVADREDAVESGFEGRVGAVGRRLRQPKRMRRSAGRLAGGTSTPPSARGALASARTASGR